MIEPKEKPSNGPSRIEQIKQSGIELTQREIQIIHAAEVDAHRQKEHYWGIIGGLVLVVFVLLICLISITFDVSHDPILTP